MMPPLNAKRRPAVMADRLAMELLGYWSMGDVSDWIGRRRIKKKKKERFLYGHCKGGRDNKSGLISH
jgi:hypothetical protein